MDKYILTIVAVKDIIDELATYDDERCKFVEGPKPAQIFGEYVIVPYTDEELRGMKE